MYRGREKRVMDRDEGHRGDTEREAARRKQTMTKGFDIAGGDRKSVV